MESNEFRIGNRVSVFCKKDGYFYENDCYTEVVIDAIHHNEIYFGVPDIATFNHVSFTSELDKEGIFTRGILLTEERFRKLGFKKNKEQNYFYTFTVCGKGLVYKDGYFIFCGITIEVPIKFIHQLQNLYFALTQTELIGP